jgi:hypothetical protein
MTIGQVLSSNTKPWLSVVGLQILLAMFFGSLVFLWQPDHGLFFEFRDKVLVQMLPAIFERYQLAIICGAGALAAFFCIRRNDFNNTSLPKQLFLITGLSFFFYVVILTRMMQYPIATDDAYHDYRYVYNWVNGISFDYNPGERVMGFTSHLNLCILALVSFLFNRNDIALVAQILNTVWQATTYLIIFVMLRAAYKSNLLALFAAAIFATSTYMIQEVRTGKESSLIMLLIVVALYFLRRGKWPAFAWLSSLIALARPEGVIWLITAIIRSGKNKWFCKNSIWIAPITLIAIWYAFLWFYFGTIVPHGALGRSTMFHSFVVPGDHTAYFIFATLGESIFQNIFCAGFMQIIGYYGAFAVQGLFGILLFGRISRHHRWLLFYFIATTSLIGFFALTDPWFFSWYYSWFALIPIFVVPLVVQICVKFGRQSKDSLTKVLTFFLVACLIDISLAVHPYSNNILTIPWGLSEILQLQFSVLRSQVLVWDAESERLLLYRRAIEFLSTDKLKGACLASWEPGMIGMTAISNPILDLGGLLSQAPLKYYPAPLNQRTSLRMWGSIPVQAVLELKPDYLIGLDAYCDNGLLKDEQFLSQYRLLKFWPLKVWGGNGLYLFQHVK